jgi:hypothetical protein
MRLKLLKWTKKIDDEGTLYWTADRGGYLIWVAGSAAFVAEGLEEGSKRFPNLKEAADTCDADYWHLVVH